MPHISVKMLQGRTEEQKQELAEKLRNTLVETLGCSPNYVSVSVQDYTALQWQDQFRELVTDNMENVRIQPQYDPKDLL